MRGHTKENYYKLIGYPDDYKNKRGGYQPRDGQARGTLTTANNVVGPTNMNTPGTSHTKSGDYFFTEAQYQQILNFLSKDESNETQTQAHMYNCLSFINCAYIKLDSRLRGYTSYNFHI